MVDAVLPVVASYAIHLLATQTEGLSSDLGEWNTKVIIPPTYNTDDQINTLDQFAMTVKIERTGGINIGIPLPADSHTTSSRFYP